MSSIDTRAGRSTNSERDQYRVDTAPVPTLADRMQGLRQFRTGTIVLLLVAIAFILRLWELGERAMHHDESLDAWWSWRFRNGVVDPYDPTYHGPLRFFVTAGFYELFGESEATARLFSALCGTAVVGLPYFLRHELGRVGTITSAVALTISPTMLYYSRFGREDAQIVFLSLAAMVLGISYLRRPRTIAAAALAFTLACSFAIKESTYLFAMLLVVYLLVVIAAQFDAQNRVRRGIAAHDQQLNPAFVASTLLLATVGLLVVVVVGNAADELFVLIAAYIAALVGFVAVTALPAIRDARQSVVPIEWPPLIRSLGAIGPVGWLITVAAFVVPWLLFFTIWFRIPGDWAAGFTEAVTYWDSQQEVNRGGEPWTYYLYALPSYEWLFVILAAIGSWRGLRRPTLESILFIWFAVGSLILYSYAGERMPWLISHPLLPMLILAGVGGQQLWQHRNGAAMPVVATFLALGLLATTATSLRASFPNGEDSRELLTQAGQATPHVLTVLERLDNIDAISIRETGAPAKLAIGTANAWPYSWYLRDRADIAWFNADTGPPTDGSVDVIIVDHGSVDLANFEDYQSTLFAMRSWWVPTYNDAGPIGWLRYMRNRTLWKQGPNPNFSGVTEVEPEQRPASIGETLRRLQNGVDASSRFWVDFARAGDERVPAPDPNATVEHDGRDGCGSVDQWFLVHDRFAFSEQIVYPDSIADMAPLACASDSTSTS